ncbi:addiction module antitoxin RelB [bacterium]|nr:addiction module antitoxin RelB [bacterium]
MSPQYQSILSTVLELPEAERERLMCDLLDSLSDVSISDLAPEWLGELERRAAEIKSGKVKGVPWETIQQQLRERLQQYAADTLPS